MIDLRRLALPLLLGAAFAPPSASLAEGSAQTDLPNPQGLFGSVLLRVDILDASNEVIVWNGQGTVDAYSPTGTLLGTFSSGEIITPVAGETGAYRIDPAEDQFFSATNTPPYTFYTWDLAVRDATTGIELPGRLWSNGWQLNGGNFGQSNSADFSVYALVPAGGATDTLVYEMRLKGSAGYIYQLVGNRAGISAAGLHPGVSVSQFAGHYNLPEYPLYLSPPEVATHTSLTPNLSAEGYASSGPLCDLVTPGIHDGLFSFTSDVSGTYHLICDLNGDSVFDLSSLSDLHLIGQVFPSTNTITWDGLDNAGDAVADGSYDCQVMITVGELHYSAGDIETCYEGLRIFRLDGAGGVWPTSMYWNDALIQSSAYAYGEVTASGTPGTIIPAGSRVRTTWNLTMETTQAATIGAGGSVDILVRSVVPRVITANAGSFTVIGSPVSGWTSVTNAANIMSGLFGATTMPNGLVSAITSGPTGISSGDPSQPPVPHTTTTAGTSRAWGNFYSNANAPGKGDSTYLDTFTWEDADYSAVHSVEVLGATVASDTDGIPDHQERCVLGTDPDLDDSDGDSVNDFVETQGGTTAVNTDGTGLIDALDIDDDDDGILTVNEDPNGNGDPTDDDGDGDGIADYLDPDHDDGPLGDPDGDGVANLTDNCATVANLQQQDLDGDGLGDACDPDADGDGADATSDCDDLDAAVQTGTDYYLDSDDDGFGEAGTATPLCGAPPVGYADNDTDNCPGLFNTDQADVDADGVGDVCDNCPTVPNDTQTDSDGEGLGDLCDNCPTVTNLGQDNLDGDGLGDLCDDDVDGDGADRSADCDDRDPAVGAGWTYYPDGDQDGFGDSALPVEDCSPTAPPLMTETGGDNCPFDSNPGQEDLDSDGEGDACDSDADGDGVDLGNDCDDLDPGVDSLQTFCSDGDGDGFGDPAETSSLCASNAPPGFAASCDDNCPSEANPDQADHDGDGEGDACDPDAPDGGTPEDGGSEDGGNPDAGTPTDGGGGGGEEKGCSCEAAGSRRGAPALALLLGSLALLGRRRRRA